MNIAYLILNTRVYQNLKIVNLAYRRFIVSMTVCSYKYYTTVIPRLTRKLQIFRKQKKLPLTNKSKFKVHRTITFYFDTISDKINS